MNTPTQTLNSLLLPLNGFHLVLPQAAVAEIVPRPEIFAMSGAPDWLLGDLRWRNERVPLISFEALCGEDGGAGQNHTCVAVLYVLSDLEGLTYYAVGLRAIPRPAVLAPEDLSNERERRVNNSIIAANVMVGGHRAAIPALDEVERMILDQLPAAEQRHN